MIETTPESALFLACARARPDCAAVARIATLATAPINWEVATRLGIRHGLASLMHRHLEAAGVEIPRSAGAALWARAQWSARRGQSMADELERIAIGFHRSGVRFVSFKGPLLAERLLGDVGLRESGDLDLLVSPRHVRAAWDVLESLGYAPTTPLDEERERLWLASPHRHELAFSEPRSGCLVELQWRANPELDVPAIDDAAWWDRAPAFEWRGLEMTAIPGDEELLALLVHGTKHFWGSLDWLVDVAELSRRPDAPWPGLVRLAREHRAVRRAALGLDLAHKLLEAPRSELVSQLIDESGVEPIARQLLPRLLQPAFDAPSVSQAARLQLALDDDTKQRARRVLRSLQPTPGDWDWVRLPRGLSALYWLLRPLRLAAKYLTRSPRIPAAATPRTPPPRPHSTG